MGKLLNFYGNSDLTGIDPRVVAIVTAAAKASPYDVKVTDGMRVGGKGNHKHGYAMDVQLVDPSTGKALPNKMYYSGTEKVIPGAVEAYGAYEHLAQTARAIQKANYPELNRTFRWGGGFKGGGTPFDMMHFDITPSANGAMYYYNWETGATAPAKAQGLGFTSLGPKASGGPVPPLGLNNEAFPVTASRQIDQKRMQFEAQVQGTPLPRRRPMQPGETRVADGSPVPATISPALSAARRVNPQSITDTRSLLQALNGLDSDAGLSVTPRLPEGYDFGDPDPTKFAAPSNNGRKNYAPVSVPMDQSGVQARATLLDEGVGSLLNPRSPAPSSPNPTPAKPVSANANRTDLADEMATLRQLVGTAPKVSRSTTTVAGRPDAPIGSMPAGKPEPSIIKTTGGIAGTAELPANYRPPASLMPTTAPVSANANLTSAKAEQATQRGNTLAKPATALISVANPEYTAWVKKYGTSPVNAAAVGKLEDIHDRQAAAQGYGALPPVPANRPPAPPKMITVSKPSNNTLSAPVPAPREARPASTIVQFGNYLYDSSQRAPTGGFLKVGKVDKRATGGGGGNTLSMPKTTTPTTTTGKGVTGNAAFAAWAFG